jgi:SAM-dependent methyltransferase
MAKRNIKFFGFRKYFIINGDIRSLPFPNEKFDIIIDFSTTDHLPLTDFKKTVKEVYRVLKENGVYLIYHLNSKYFNINRWNYYYKRRNKVGSVSIPSFPRKLERVESLIKKENFYVWKKEYCYPFYFDDNLFIHYIFLFNKLFNYLNSRLLFSYLNLPSFNLFFYLIAIKR